MVLYQGGSAGNIEALPRSGSQAFVPCQCARASHGAIPRGAQRAALRRSRLPGTEFVPSELVPNTELVSSKLYGAIEYSSPILKCLKTTLKQTER